MENQVQSGPFDQSDSARTLALVVEGQKFWVSREMLALCSPVFKAMLYGDFAEAKKDFIDLPGKKAADVEVFLYCLIPMPESKEIDQSNSDVILAFADEYQIVELRRRAEVFWALALERCKKGDGQLLEILIVACKWRLKILGQCLNRCVEEITLDEMVPIIKDLPEEVKMYLSVGGSGCLLKVIWKPQGNCCDNWNKSDQFGYVKCLFCGRGGCTYCLAKSLTCGGKTKVNQMKKAFLENYMSSK